MRNHPRAKPSVGRMGRGGEMDDGNRARRRAGLLRWFRWQGAPLLVWGAMMAGGVAPAHGQSLTYACPAGDLAFEVQRAVGTGTLVDPQFVIVRISAGEQFDPADLDPAYVLPMVSAGRYAGPEGSFSMFDLKLTLADGSSLGCEDDVPVRDASAPADAGFGPGSTPDPLEVNQQFLDVPGLSLGGKVRGAPGLDGARVTSLAEGTPVTIVMNTGVWMDGYYWFLLERDGRRLGYQWGGILCAPDREIEGLFPCP